MKKPTIVVIINRKAVTTLNGKYINACFPNTVELPQQKASNKVFAKRVENWINKGLNKNFSTDLQD